VYYSGGGSRGGVWFSVKAALNITVIKNNEKNKIYLFRVAFSVDYNPVYNMSFLSEFKRLLYMMPNQRFRCTICDYNNLYNAVGGGDGVSTKSVW